ncbi:UNVERIFIED_CONTAM: hypothetical protein FKN15_065613 [Acipenser sinensis]
MVSESVGAPTTQRMDFKELIEMINRNTAAQIEQTKKWRQELGLPDPEPTELELLLQKWEQASVAPQSPEPEGEELPLPLPEPRGEEPPLPEPRGEEVKSRPPPQPRPPPLQSSSALLRPVPQPLLLDTLPVFLDLPVLDLEPRSLQHWPQLCPWFPAPLSPSTQTSLGCCQTLLLLPLFAASLPLGDRTSLRRFPGEDLCTLRHPPVPRPTLRSALSARWGPMSPVRGPFLAAPEGPTHPQARPCKRAAMDIAGLEAGIALACNLLSLGTIVVQTLIGNPEIDTIKLDREKQKALAKRKATPVVGDMQALADALPDLSELLTASRIRSIKKLKTIVKKPEPKEFSKMKHAQKRKFLLEEDRLHTAPSQQFNTFCLVKPQLQYIACSPRFQTPKH